MKFISIELWFVTSKSNKANRNDCKGMYAFVSTTILGRSKCPKIITMFRLCFSKYNLIFRILPNNKFLRKKMCYIFSPFLVRLFTEYICVFGKSNHIFYVENRSCTWLFSEST